MPKTDADRKHPALRDAVSPLALTGLDQPLWLQNSSYPASLDRLLIGSTLQPGVLGNAELAVSQRAAGANMSVDVAAGRAVVPMTDAPNQGSALCRSTAVNNLTVGGAPAAGLTRIDLVVARVYDASLIGGSINGWQLEIVPGTAASTPAAPAVPASAIPLAQISIASGVASVTNAMISNRRIFPANVGGWLSGYFNSAVAPTTPAVLTVGNITIPRAGSLLVHGHANMIGGVPGQQVTVIDLQVSVPTPEYTPNSTANVPSNGYATVPVLVGWNAVTAGQTVTVKVRFNANFAGLGNITLNDIYLGWKIL